MKGSSPFIISSPIIMFDIFGALMYFVRRIGKGFKQIYKTNFPLNILDLNFKLSLHQLGHFDLY